MWVCCTYRELVTSVIFCESFLRRKSLHPKSPFGKITSKGIREALFPLPEFNCFLKANSFNDLIFPFQN